ncbi:hypothetical protein N9K77_01425 [bacterium]|nr:hypothetical protein [bacterium]
MDDHKSKIKFGVLTSYQLRNFEIGQYSLEKKPLSVYFPSLDLNIENLNSLLVTTNRNYLQEIANVFILCSRLLASFF